MSREIKFRAWDRSESRMTMAESLENLMTQESIPRAWVEDLVFIQYTGLKDKNGVEIYEGDYLGLTGEVWGFVKFEDGAFVIDVDSQTQENTRLNQARCIRFEVIGNIYQNPELLGQSND